MTKSILMEIARTLVVLAICAGTICKIVFQNFSHDPCKAPVAALLNSGRMTSLICSESTPTVIERCVFDWGEQQLSDDILYHVGRIKTLRELSTGGGGPIQFIRRSRDCVSDSGIAHLASLTKLHRLEINCTGVTDTGLRCLAGMSEMRSLELAGTSINGTGLSELRFDELQVLNLHETRCDNASIAHILHFKKLRTLKIAGTRISQLSQFAHLNCFASDGTGICL